MLNRKKISQFRAVIGCERHGSAALPNNRGAQRNDSQNSHFADSPDPLASKCNQGGPRRGFPNAISSDGLKPTGQAERSVFRLLAFGGNGRRCSGCAGIGEKQDSAICACLAAVFGVNGFREALTGMVSMGHAASSIVQG
jgi:hypothetical protein